MSSPSPSSSNRLPSQPNFLTNRYRSFCDANTRADAYRQPVYDGPSSRPCGHDGHIPDHRISKTNVNNSPAANDRTASEMESSLKCCCGRTDCAYLEHNNVAVAALEQDLERAAKLGQVRDIDFLSFPLFLFLLHFTLECSIMRKRLGFGFDAKAKRGQNGSFGTSGKERTSLGRRRLSVVVQCDTIARASYH